MSEINIKITAQESDFNTFADELGYQDLVVKTNEEIALLPQPVALEDRVKPNPQTKVQFLEDYLKTLMVTELYKKKATVIDNQINAVKEAEKVALKAGIASAVGVTSII